MEVDIAMNYGIPPERYEEAKNLPGRDIIIDPITSMEVIYFNLGKPQFKDPRVRRALCLAFDKEKIIKDLYYGTAIRSLSYLPSRHWACCTELKDPGYNPREAVQILEGAGWRVGPDGIRQKDGVKLQFVNATSAGLKSREQTQLLIQQQWREIGVAMEIKNGPASVVMGDYFTKSQFETTMSAIYPQIGVDPDFLDRAHSKQIPIKYGVGSNFNQYENPQLDKLLEEGQITLDQTKRKEIYWKVQKIIDQDMPWAPIFNWTQIIGKNSGLTGFKRNAYATARVWNARDWDWT